MLVEYAWNTANTSLREFFMVDINTASSVLGVHFGLGAMHPDSASGNLRGMRHVYDVSFNSISFGDYSYLNVFDNYYAIPTKIYGMKLSLLKD